MGAVCIPDELKLPLEKLQDVDKQDLFQGVLLKLSLIGDREGSYYIEDEEENM